MIAFVCASPIQVIRAFQMKLRMPEFGDDADLFLCSSFKGATEIAERIRRENIFNETQYLDTRVLGKASTFKMLYSSAFSKALKQRKYSKLVSFNIENNIVQALYNINKHNLNFEYHCVEDCPAIYNVYLAHPYKRFDLHKILHIEKQCFHITAWWSSCPQFISVPAEYTTDIRKLPKINVDDTELLELVNRVFNYKPDPILDEANALIMEESHFTDGFITDNSDYVLYKKIKNRYPELNFAVKLHPRTKVNRFKNDFPVMHAQNIPWELFVWNRINVDSPELMQISIVCSTMVSDKLLFDDEGQKVILSKLFYDKIKSVNGVSRISEAVTEMFENISQTYHNSQKLFIPENEIELFDFLDKYIRRRNHQ